MINDDVWPLCGSWKLSVIGYQGLGCGCLRAWILAGFYAFGELDDDK